MATRAHRGIRGLPADYAIHGRCAVGSDSQALPKGAVGLFPVHVGMGGGGRNGIHSDRAVAQLAAGSVVVMAGIHGVA